jgi:hypothetical protein
MKHTTTSITFLRTAFNSLSGSYSVRFASRYITFSAFVQGLTKAICSDFDMGRERGYNLVFVTESP